jgi:hypothetical protein
MRFIWGIISILVGVALVKYSFSITNFFGHLGWAEEHLGGGGTNSLYKIAGVTLIILSFLYMFGNIGFITGPLSPLFGGT